MKQLLISIKTKIQRASTWISLFNSAALLFIVLTKLREFGWAINLKLWFIPILLMGAGLLILFGWIEDKLGFWRAEQKFAGERNPYFTEIIKRLERIETKQLGQTNNKLKTDIDIIDSLSAGCGTK